ncbi:hypothetical protein Xthr_12445 [Xanthomonas citri pv. thirumalacharii]|nr:hypothetical protein [Xanthomonas citri pv. thirumalacharii]
MRWLSAVRWRSIAANIYRGGRAAGDDLVSAWAGRARRLRSRQRRPAAATAAAMLRVVGLHS